MRVLIMLLSRFTQVLTGLRLSKKLQSTRPLKPLLLSLLFSVSCQTTQIPEIHPGITLPASGDGFQVDTLTGAQIVVPAALWKLKLPRGIILFSDDWQTLKTTLLNNCMESTCAQAVGALDSLFQTIDKALQKMPSPLDITVQQIKK